MNLYRAFHIWPKYIKSKTMSDRNYRMSVGFRYILDLRLFSEACKYTRVGGSYTDYIIFRFENLMKELDSGDVISDE